MCRVLVVDDDPSVVALCVFALEFEGHQAVGFTDLPQALEAARRERFDVLVADVPTAGDAVLTAGGDAVAIPMLLIAEDSFRLLQILTSVVRTDVYGLAKPFDIGEFVDEVQRLAHARAA